MRQRAKFHICTTQCWIFSQVFFLKSSFKKCPPNRANQLVPHTNHASVMQFCLVHTILKVQLLKRSVYSDKIVCSAFIWRVCMESVQMLFKKMKPAPFFLTHQPCNRSTNVYAVDQFRAIWDFWIYCVHALSFSPKQEKKKKNPEWVHLIKLAW